MVFRKGIRRQKQNLPDLPGEQTVPKKVLQSPRGERASNGFVACAPPVTERGEPETNRTFAPAHAPKNIARRESPTGGQPLRHLQRIPPGPQVLDCASPLSSLPPKRRTRLIQVCDALASHPIQAAFGTTHGRHHDQNQWPAGYSVHRPGSDSETERRPTRKDSGHF